MITTAGAKYTVELTPHMEWLTEKKVLATRDISSSPWAFFMDNCPKQQSMMVTMPLNMF